MNDETIFLMHKVFNVFPVVEFEGHEAAATRLARIDKRLGCGRFLKDVLDLTLSRFKHSASRAAPVSGVRGRPSKEIENRSMRFSIIRILHYRGSTPLASILIGKIAPQKSRTDNAPDNTSTVVR